VLRVQRELFESSLMSARSVLEALGYPAAEARRAAMGFRRHNLSLAERLRPPQKDRAKLVATIQAGRAQFEEQMAQERADRASLRQAAVEGSLADWSAGRTDAPAAR
jgi:glutathione-regulated potassium-efflux system ancillary protein KefC